MLGDVLCCNISTQFKAFPFLTLGIYDILMAVKWIRENIEAFNGDPDNISVFGQGSGAITISMLLMSPLSQGLFSRAIIQSGTFLSFYQNPMEYNLDLGQRLAEGVDCASANRTLRKNPKEVVDCLRGKIIVSNWF